MTSAATVPVGQPEPVWVKRWRCPYCRRSRSARKAAAEHIARCWLNPAARACKTCVHYDYEPSGEWCFPGRACNCNEGFERCAAGIGLDGGLRTGCPLWELRPADESGEA